MLSLDDPKWKEFQGGYNVKYDASRKLIELENSPHHAQTELIISELFENLYHQGDVNLASYYSVPHLIRIGIEKSLNNWRLLLLICSIEIARQENNPELPKEYLEEYRNSLNKGIDLIKLNQEKECDSLFWYCSSSLIAAVNGQYELAKIILELSIIESKHLAAFTENYEYVAEWMEREGLMNEE